MATETVNIISIAKSLDYTHRKTSPTQQNANAYIYTDLYQYLGADWWLYSGKTNTSKPLEYSNEVFKTPNISASSNTDGYTAIPITRILNITHLQFKMRRTSKYDSWSWAGICLCKNNNGTPQYKFDNKYNVGNDNDTPNLNQWYTFNYDVSIDAIDYLIINRASGSYEFKDIILTYTITYSWSPITSISGNGETYILAKIASASLNDGESVSGASASDFEVFNNKSSLSKLIDDVMQDGLLVNVKYTIPSGTYEYIKLVYKKGSIPTSYSDGTAINIQQSDTESEISGIADGDTYWFVIFTDKSVSEPKSIETVVPPIPPESDEYDEIMFYDDVEISEVS